MSEESRLNERRTIRPLKPAERAILEAMLSGRYERSKLAESLTSYEAEEMRDGGMGSIRLISPEPHPRHFAQTLAKAEYMDEDGLLVSIAVSGDERGEPYEMDFWKVDFSPLRRYPQPSDLHFGHADTESYVPK